jgi:hypothetical protein
MTPQQNILIDNWESVCDMVENGHTIREISAHYKVNISDINRVNRANPELYKRYAQARESSAEAFEEEVIKAARDGTGDVARDRLMVDSAKWVAARRNQKLFGDKQEIKADINAQVTKVEIEFQ